MVPRIREVVTPDGVITRRKPIIGDLRWDGSVWRRWSGRRWTKAAYSLRPAQLADPRLVEAGTVVDAAARQRALDIAVEDQVARRGASVVFSGPSGVVLSYRRRVSHLVHALLTVLTAGVWLLFWVIAAVTAGEDRVRFEIDRWGNVWAVPVARRT